MNETSALLNLALFRGGDDETDKALFHCPSNSFPNGSVVVVMMLARFNALQIQLVRQASLCWSRKAKMPFSPKSQ